MAKGNPITKDMTPEEEAEFYEKCKNSNSYFWNNYIRRIPGNENLPEFSEKRWKDWQEYAEKFRFKPRSRR